MWYAIYPGDDYYHLMKPKSSTYTLCGLPTLKRDRSGGGYRPPARMLPGQPPSALYRLCPRCVAEANSAKLRVEG